MSNLYKMIKPEDGDYVQYVGVYVLNWRPEWGEPEVAFVENEDPKQEAAEDMYEALRLVEFVTVAHAGSCPVCGGWEEVGHNDECELDEALKKAQRLD